MCCGNKDNKLLIIGNGFDLSIGLDSTFSSFLSSYDNSIDRFNHMICDKSKEEYPKNGLRQSNNTVLEHINKTLILGSNKGTYINLKAGARSKFIIDYIEILIKYKSKIHINFWAYYLYLERKEGVYNWSSVEDQIYNLITYSNSNLLELVKYFINQFKLDKLINSRKLYKDKNLIEFNKAKSNRESLKSQDIDMLIFFIIFSVLDTPIKYRTTSFKIPYSSDIKINPIDLILNDAFKYLKYQLLEFEKDLNNYLIKQVKKYINKKNNPNHYSYKDVGTRLINCLIKNSSFSLLNFNYTNPLNTLNHNSRNIHGILTKPATKYFDRTSPVIGISDNKININNRAYSFTKNYRIMRLSCNNYPDILHDKISEIVFFGHSLDKADQVYFFNIFDHYNIQNCKIKLVFYYIDHDNKTDSQCAIDQMNNIDSLFKSYSAYYYKEYHKRLGMKNLMHKLSFRGKLIITNLRDTVKKDKILSKIIR